MSTEQDFYSAPGETSQGRVFTVTGQDWDSVTQSIGDAAEERVVVAVDERALVGDVAHQEYDLRWSGGGTVAPLYSTGMPPSG